MIKTRFFSVIGGALLSAVAMSDAGAADACASSDNVWNDQTGQWNLYQSSNGNVTGTLISNGNTACPANRMWAVAGHHNNDGSFTYTATYVAPLPRSESCVASIALQGNIFKPGCNNSTGTWTNSASRTGTFDLHASCRVPTETVPQFKNWGDGETSQYPFDGHSQTSAKWEQNLNPTDYNYGGRYVQEFFAADAVDTCYFVGSSIPKVVTMDGKGKSNIQNYLPSFFVDWVGMEEHTVNYYRSMNRSPCGYTLKQRMKIDCDFGEYIYQINTLEMSQDPWKVYSKRAASAPKERAWGILPPKISASINAIITLIMGD
jgi:hypothetical protein